MDKSTTWKPTLGDTVYSESDIPLHTHVWYWDYDAIEEISGVACSVTWYIQPGPKGKRPRVRSCRVTYDMEQVMAIFEAATPNTNREIATTEQIAYVRSK